MRKNWWKIVTVLLLLYTCTAGFFVPIPSPPGVPLQETIRNLFFHVCMWFAMMVLFALSVIESVKYLRSSNAISDYKSFAYAKVGTLLGVLGIVTGMIWANYQWNKPWSGDPKQNGAAIALLIYFAYFVLRGSVYDEEKKMRISAVYNIFAFAMLFPTLFILPRLTESLHPGGEGSDGNPALNPADTTFMMRLVFYPAIIGWSLLGYWIATLQIRLSIVQAKQTNNE